MYHVLSQQACLFRGFSNLDRVKQGGSTTFVLQGQLSLVLRNTLHASHDSPIAQTCTFDGPGATNTTKIPPEDLQEREEIMKIVAAGEKKTKFGAVPAGRARTRRGGRVLWGEEGGSPGGGGRVHGQGRAGPWGRGKGEEGGGVKLFNVKRTPKLCMFTSVARVLL